MDWHYVTAAGRCEGEITTLAPSRANMCAVAAPMPDAAPEMMATLSASLIAVSSLCLECCSAADEAGPPFLCEGPNRLLMVLGKVRVRLKAEDDSTAGGLGTRTSISILRRPTPPGSIKWKYGSPFSPPKPWPA